MILEQVYHECYNCIEVIYLEKQGKASTRAKNKYNANNYDSLRIVVPKGNKTAIEAFAISKGQSVNGLVNDLLRTSMGLTESEWKRTEEENDA